jgi:hypothetical protein
MEQHRASPADKHIFHRSPQKLGTTAEQAFKGITNHVTRLLQCLQLCYMVHVKQGSERLSPMNVKSLCTFRFWLPSCGLPYCLIWLATGLTGAAHAAPGHTISRTTSITLHLACVLACALD